MIVGRSEMTRPELKRLASGSCLKMLMKPGAAPKNVAYRGAINHYDQATRLDPTNHKIFFKMAEAYRKKEDWDKVASTFATFAGWISSV